MRWDSGLVGAQDGQGVCVEDVGAWACDRNFHHHVIVRIGQRCGTSVGANPGSSNGLHELDAIPKWISDEDALKAR